MGWEAAAALGVALTVACVLGVQEAVRGVLSWRMRWLEGELCEERRRCRELVLRLQEERSTREHGSGAYRSPAPREE